MKLHWDSSQISCGYESGRAAPAPGIGGASWGSAGEFALVVWLGLEPRSLEGAVSTLKCFLGVCAHLRQVFC